MISDLEARGGAAIATSRLAEGLARLGVEVTRLVVYPSSTHSDFWKIESLSSHPGPLWLKGLRFLGNDNVFQGFVARLQRTVEVQKAIFLLKKNPPDLINLHNIHYAGWTAADIEAICKLAPTVWTLHDMWSFTGRCAYSKGCEKFTTGCDETCPTPNEYPVLNRSDIAKAWQEKKDLLMHLEGLVGVSPSRWLAENASYGIWAGHRVEVIPNGIDLAMFRPIPKCDARRVLGLDANKITFLVLADRASEGRKGENILNRVLNSIILNKPVQVIAIGDTEAIDCPSRLSLQPFGFVNDVRLLAILFAAADLLIYPSVADNLPNVLLEATACDTPCIAFRVGGIPEIIEEDLNGWIVSNVNAEAMAKQVQQIVRQQKYLSTIGQCRSVAEAKYSFDVQARRYIELFEQCRNSKKK